MLLKPLSPPLLLYTRALSATSSTGLVLSASFWEMTRSVSSVLVEASAPSVTVTVMV
ncbi:hypothetical protein D3C72_2200760 [compost metagenome]